MYEHPIKRAGLTFSRILYSNTKAIQVGFPEVNYNKFSFSYSEKLFKQGKMTKNELVTSENLDKVFPPAESAE